MCGRYRLGRGREAFLKYFGADRENFDWSPRFNIAPTQQVPTIRQDGRSPQRKLSTMRWGLIPYWASDPAIGAKMINARAESVGSKPAFREALAKRRCLIPADGFYEWKKIDHKTKQPYCFQMNDEDVFGFAGIWDRWRNPSGQYIETCSILTTTPNPLTADVHDRMPVILDKRVHELWLDPGFSHVESLTEMLKPFEASRMKKYPVSTRVNLAANDDAECSEPQEETVVSGTLFDL